METSNHEIVGESFNEIRDEITKIRQELRKYLEVWGHNRVVVQDSEKKKDCVDETDILKTHNYQTTFDGEIKAMAEDFNNKDVDSESEDPEVVITQYDLKTTLVSNHFNGDNLKQENIHVTREGIYDPFNPGINKKLESDIIEIRESQNDKTVNSKTTMNENRCTSEEVKKQELDNTKYEKIPEVTALKYFSANSANVNGTILGGDVFPSTESLHFASNNLEGELLASSSTLMQMKSLWLNGNVLNGTILILNGMTSLAELWFNGNTFIGPIVDVSSLGSTQNFSLRDNGFTGVVPDSLMKFPNLTVVNLTDNLLQGQTPSFGKGVVVDMTGGSNSFCLKDPGTPCGSRLNILLAIASSLGYLKSFAQSWKGITCDSKGNIIVVNFLNINIWDPGINIIMKHVSQLEQDVRKGLLMECMISIRNLDPCLCPCYLDVYGAAGIITQMDCLINNTDALEATSYANENELLVRTSSDGAWPNDLWSKGPGKFGSGRETLMEPAYIAHNNITPQNFEKLFEQSAGELPDFTEIGEKKNGLACRIFSKLGVDNACVVDHIDKLIQRQPDSGFKEACQSTIGSLAGKYLRKESDGDVFGLFVKPLFETMAQNEVMQAGAALCMVMFLWKLLLMAKWLCSLDWLYTQDVFPSWTENF